MMKAGRPGRTRTLRAASVAVLSLLLGLGVFRAVGANGRELGGAVTVLAHPLPGWILLALLFEVGSFLAYALAQRRLLTATKHRLSTGWLASLAVSAQALSNFLPAGYLAANALNFRELRRRGMQTGEAVWLLLMSSVLYIGTLGALAVVGTGLVGGRESGPIRYLAIGASVLALGLLLALWLFASSPSGHSAPTPVPSGPASRFATLRAHAVEASRTLRSSLGQVKLSPQRMAGALSLFGACWLLDAGCLIASFQAVAAPIPWSSLLVAYSGAQLLSFLPVVPGGMGLVEGSLTIALAAHGLGSVHVLSAVLLYRAISYWATLPAGAAGYVVLRRTRPETNGEARVASPEWPLPTVSAARSNT